MKRKIIFVSTMIMILVITVASASASGLPGSGWWSGGSVQNISTGSITVSIVAYNSASSSTYTASSSVNPDEKFTWTPTNFTPTMPSDFKGSAVVSADGPIKAIVTTTNRQSGSFGVLGGKASAVYQGIDGSAVSTTIYFPSVKGDSYGQTTSYYVQNAGTSATTATATFKMKNGDTHVYTTPSVGPNQMVVFGVGDALTFTTSCSPKPQCVSGALTVVSNTTQPLAGVMMMHLTTENPATLAGSTRGFTSTDFDTKLYAAGVKNLRGGRFTGIQVQNVTASTPLTVTVTYKGNKGACTGNTYSDTKTNVAAGTSAVFNQLSGQTTLPTDCQASATIETTTPGGQIVALIAQQYEASHIPASGQILTQYFAMPNNYVTTKLGAPQFKDDRYSKRSGLVIQNVGTAQATNVVATFKCTGSATFTAISVAQTVDPGYGVQFYHPSTTPSMFTVGNPFSAANVTCSVIVTSDQPVVGLMSEDPVAPYEEDVSNYEVFNLTP
jgi:hypothetical protein